jgi:hypothetical protein
MNRDVIHRFREFVEKCKGAPIVRGQPPSDLTEKFLSFIQVANPLLESGLESIVGKDPRPDLEGSFNEFIRASLPLIVADLKQCLPELTERAATAQGWIICDDLLEVAGLRFVEDAYTELMRWALAPETHPPSALDRQRAWLQSADLDVRICEGMPCDPQTQLWTEDGVPDLVLRFRGGTVIVENKTGSPEHDTPSGKPQTVSYPQAVRQKFNLGEETPVSVVFITPEGLPARNPEAKRATFVEFVIALIRVLNEHGLSRVKGTGAAYAMLFTHFLNCATATNLQGKELIDQIIVWSKEPDWHSEARILERRVELLTAVEMLLPERTRHD